MRGSLARERALWPVVVAAAALLLTAPQAFAGRAVTTRPGLLASPTLGLPATAAALAPTYAPQAFALRLDADPHPAAFVLFGDLAPAPLEPEKLASGVESWELTPNLQRIQVFVADTRWCRDFLGPLDSPNLYQAFGLDPQNNTDPMGECLFGIGGTCAEWANEVAGAFEAAKKKVRKHTDGSMVGVLIDYGVSTNLDVIETFFVDPFRAGDAVGQAVGEGAGAGTVALAAVQDAGRVAALAAGAGATVKAGGRAVRANRGAAKLDDASGAAAKALREGSLDTSSYLDNYARDFKAPQPATATSGVGSSAPKSGVLDREAVTKGFQDHHIISNKNPLTRDHELLREAGGFDLETRANKIYLPGDAALHPTRSIHLGRHKIKVSRDLAEQMDAVLETGRSQGWTQQEFEAALRELIREERMALRSGERALNKNMRPWAK